MSGSSSPRSSPGWWRTPHATPDRPQKKRPQGRGERRQAAGRPPPAPLLAVSPSEAKTQLEALPWVRSAAVERRLPDTLHIRLVERQPLAFWQRQGKLVLIDRDGVVITGDRLERFPGLVVIVGDDAPK